MGRNLKISVALVVVFVLVLGGVVLAGGGDDEGAKKSETTATTAAPKAQSERVVRPDARLLGKPGRRNVTFTEFLDFECESCRAAFPAIEQLRREYAGRVTFAIRYFPVPSHRNAENAAFAVEAAAQQGKLVPMYKRMYETQKEWGEGQGSEAARFRGFAKDLGLDMAAYDAAVKNPKTLARVREDRDAGTALGVQGTPTFFIGEKMITPQSVDDIRTELDAALRAK